MKQAILTILARLTNAMKADSRSFHVSFLPIIQSAIEPESQTQVYLLEDALDLWASIVAQTPSPPEPTPPELLNLLQYLLPLFSMDNETLRKADRDHRSLPASRTCRCPCRQLSSGHPPSASRAFGKSQARGERHDDAPRAMHYSGRGRRWGRRSREGPDCGSALDRLPCQGSRRPTRRVDAPPVPRPISRTSLTSSRWRRRDRLLYSSRTNRARHRLPSLLEALSSVGNEGLEKTLDWLLEEWFSHIENIGDAPEQETHDARADALPRNRTELDARAAAESVRSLDRCAGRAARGHG